MPDVILSITINGERQKALCSIFSCEVKDLESILQKYTDTMADNHISSKINEAIAEKTLEERKAIVPDVEI